MKISVVMPTHNKADLLERTLRTLEKQDLPASDFEVVVVDDGSADRTPDFLSAYRPLHGMKIVRQEVNRGRAAARNRGIHAAEGELVVFLDDDMEVVPGGLRAHWEFHGRHLRHAGIGNVIMHPDLAVAPIDRYMSTRGAQKIRDRGPLPWKYFSTNNASVGRKDLLAVGAFDEGFFYYGFEDLELAWRLKKDLGLSFGFVEGARSLHIHAHSLEDVLAKKTLCGRSSLRYLFRKHPEIYRDLGYDRFDAPRPGDGFTRNAARVLYRAAFSRPVYRLVKPLAHLRLGQLSDKILDYLVQYHYLEGLRGPELPRPREARSA